MPQVRSMLDQEPKSMLEAPFGYRADHIEPCGEIVHPEGDALPT